eukprot:tig00021275_g19864.t1
MPWTGEAIRRVHLSAFAHLSVFESLELSGLWMQRASLTLMKPQRPSPPPPPPTPTPALGLQRLHPSPMLPAPAPKP